ncbi:MAG: WD40 repeat domain-containing protein [Tepidisphaerales bacterium]
MSNLLPVNCQRVTACVRVAALILLAPLVIARAADTAALATATKTMIRTASKTLLDHPDDAGAFFQFSREDDAKLILPKLGRLFQAWHGLQSATEGLKMRVAPPLAVRVVGIPLQLPADLDRAQAGLTDAGGAWIGADEDEPVFFMRKADNVWRLDTDRQLSIRDKADAGCLAVYLDALATAIETATEATLAKRLPNAATVSQEIDRITAAQLLKTSIDVPVAAPPPVAGERRFAEGQGTITGMSVSADAKLAITGHVRSATPVRFWDLQQKASIRAMSVPGMAWVDVLGIAVSPDGKRAAATGNAYPIANVIEHFRHGGVDGLRDVECEQSVWLIDAATGAVSTMPQKQGNRYSTLCFSPDGGKLLGGGQNSTLWDLGTMKSIGEFNISNAANFSPDGKVMNMEAGFAIAVIDSQKAANLRSLSLANTGPDRPLGQFAVSPDGNTIVYGTMRGMTAINATNGRVQRRFDLPGVRAMNRVNQIAYSHDGARILACCGIIAADRTGKPDPFVDLYVDASRLVCLWDGSTGRLIQSRVGHTARVTGVAFLDNERSAISCSADGTMRVWTLKQ